MERTAQINKEIERYYKDVFAHLRLSYTKKQSQEILTMIKKNTSVFFNENPESSFDDFQSVFGSSEDVVDNIIDNIDVKHLSSKVKIRKFTLCVLAICIISIATVCLVKVALDVKAYNDIENQLIDHSTTIIR